MRSHPFFHWTFTGRNADNLTSNPRMSMPRAILQKDRRQK